MAGPGAGLPMASRWDPEKLRREEAYLAGVDARPFFRRIAGYVKLTGPGLLQSAMTLGAGSAVASVVAGRSFGYKLLWVQPVAMLLGVAMMAAIGNIVLSTGERPYRSFSRELSPVIAFLWAFATVAATIIWHFPQYGLAGAAAWDLGQLAGAAEDARALPYLIKFAAGGGILAMSIFVTWHYGSHMRGIKIYEWFLRGVICVLILSFLLVVVVTTVDGRMRWLELLKGFFAFQTPKGATTVILGAIGAAVGINMTFLYPYSLLAKGWGRHHKGLSRFDLFGSMLVPFVIVTSLVIIAMGNTIYEGTDAVRKDMTPVAAARVFQDLPGRALWRIVLDLSFIAMACGAISTHMVVCGFTLCEMFGLPYTVKRYRLFTLVPAVGIIGVIFPRPLWLPILASAIALTMLPIAYISFFIMNNKRSYLGDAVGSGIRRLLYNAVLVVAIVMACVGAAVKIKTGVVDKIFPAKQAAARGATASAGVPAGTEPAAAGGTEAAGGGATRAGGEAR